METSAKELTGAGFAKGLQHLHVSMLTTMMGQLESRNQDCCSNVGTRPTSAAHTRDSKYEARTAARGLQASHFHGLLMAVSRADGGDKPKVGDLCIPPPW